MKIALNIEWVGARRGGAEKYAGVIARELHAAGHDVHVFARGADPGEVPEGITLHRVMVQKWPGCGWFRAFRFACASERALKSQSFDLIVGFNKTWYQDVYIAVAGAQPAVVEHSLQRFKGPLRRTIHKLGKVFSPKQWMFQWIEHRQFGPAARPMHVIAPSHFVARQFHEFHGLPRSQVTVVYNGIIPTIALSTHDADARTAFRLEHGLSNGDAALLFLARNYELKGLEPLLEAFAQTASKHAARPARSSAAAVIKTSLFAKNGRSSLGVADRVRFLGFVDDVQPSLPRERRLRAADVLRSLQLGRARGHALRSAGRHHGEQNGAAEMLTNRPSTASSFPLHGTWSELAAALGLTVRRRSLAKARMGAEARSPRRTLSPCRPGCSELTEVLVEHDRDATRAAELVSEVAKAA
jgi:glycosyltransferase involved in cell wall biosynthesis